MLVEFKLEWPCSKYFVGPSRPHALRILSELSLIFGPVELGISTRVLRNSKVTFLFCFAEIRVWNLCNSPHQNKRKLALLLGPEKLRTSGSRFLA